MSYNPNGYANYQSYTYQGEPIYPESYDDSGRYNYYNNNYRADIKKGVVVPKSYLAGANRTPTSHRDQDKSWVEGQNPQSYTIELADADKPAQVAGVLYKAPKNDRRAQVSYQQDGKTYYKGLYGSYNNYEAAQQALNALPADIKSGANIKSWGTVQGSVNH